jgi:LytTr DNA-binding domain-containing protein/histidine kinase/DNA gyrase B/HSP90-like ATPase
VRRGRLFVTVRDDGRGIARDAIGRVLEPGFGDGTGIGLASVHHRLTALEGRLPPGFVRIHRSYVVDLAKVAAVKRAGPDRIRLALDDAERTELDVARRQSRQVRDRLRL